MPCGSVLGGFCVQCKNFIASASKFYRKSIENLSKNESQSHTPVACDAIVAKTGEAGAILRLGFCWFQAM